MNIEIVKVGFLNENCYILSINNKSLVIDPGDEYLKIKRKLGNNELLGILITHRHFDHIGALDEFINDYNVKVFEFNNLEEKLYEIGPFKFNVIFNPGHSTDSVTYYFKNEGIMFVGDFIFKNGIGRCDLKGGNSKAMSESIDKIKKYNSCIIYPGHGDKTKLEDEKKNNPFFN